ncbi:coiled-coil domain-containing protein 55-domain containing protein [Triangularia verruculosa]|uniref:Coiled-coil domain-containing protein 55-domain containing protein n=1 Tax=Triangularia verruculosa TaxID=2587418 RepID=A0AAN6X9L1_9PEZI|nr:coiled-coil domain-containing protein 55-domain containing protein [Triangularia verruculosa]
MSKPVISFGLKKAGPPSKKPTLPARKKPAPFGGLGGDDDSDNETPQTSVSITEIDGFGTPSTNPLNNEDDTASRKKHKKSSAPPTKPPSTKPSRPTGDSTDLSSALTSRKYAQEAEAADPSVYDYDAVYDSFKAAKKPKSEDEAAAEKKPKYFSALQQAAEQRERDRQIAEEKRLKREREAEGEEFADKEKFVTEAYKRQQEENRRLEEEERRREEEEQKRSKGKGMTDFYKKMLEQKEQEHAAMMAAAQNAPKEVDGEGEKGVKEEEEKSATERAREMNAQGANVLINDDGEVVDKRQLLKGGLNVAPKKKAEVQQEKARQQAAAKSAGPGQVSRGVYAPGGKQAMRERQTRMLEAQLEESLKRSRQEEAEETAKIELATKSRKTEADVSSAKERYLARKRAAEEAKKKGLVDEP